MIKNLYLVQVVDSYGPNKFLPLAISCQWLSAAQNAAVAATWQVAGVLIEKLDIARWLDSLTSKPDLVAMSCYVWNWEYNQALGKTIKNRWPDCKIVIGGPQVSKHDPDFIRNNPWADIAVLGENESAFEQILLLDSSQLTDIPGVITASTCAICQPTRTVDLDAIPSPILTGFYDKIIEKYPKDTLWQVTYETMRGCPYQCQFCDIGDQYWNKTYFYSMDRIRKEIEWMGQNKIEYVSVCDSNWGIAERDLEITDLVIETKLKYGYPKFWDVTWAKNNTSRIQEIALRDHAAGTKLFKGITFAFQSFNPETLKATKRFNLQDSAVRNSLKLYRDNDIPTYSELIWPMPNETLNSLKLNLQTLIDLGQRDFVMVHPLVLTPNADMSRPEYIEQHGIQSKSVCLDTFWLKIPNKHTYVIEKVDAVYATRTADYNQVIQGHMLAHWLVVLYYYGWAHVILDYLTKITGYSQVKLIENFINWIETQPTELLGTEHNQTRQSINDVFAHDKFWGRQIGNSDVYWEYKSATSVNLHHRRDTLNQELAQWLLDSFDIVNPELIDLNASLCYDWQLEYPYTKTYNTELVRTCLNLSSNTVRFDHWDKSISDDTKFCHTAYHYQRKNRYWRCSVSDAE